MSEEIVKIAFSLEVEDGFPPVSLETLNASVLAGGKFKLLNSPFFVQGVAYGDIVSAKQTEKNGRYDFIELSENSGFKSISIIIFDNSLNNFLMSLLKGINAVIEYGEFGNLKMLSVSIPETSDYSKIKSILDHYENEDKISYAELAL